MSHRAYPDRYRMGGGVPLFAQIIARQTLLAAITTPIVIAAVGP